MALPISLLLSPALSLRILSEGTAMNLPSPPHPFSRTVSAEGSMAKPLGRDLARDEENYRLLAENSTDLIIRVSIEGICLYVSPASLELLGYRPEELVGRQAFDFIHPLDKRAVADALEPEILFRSHRKVICRLRKKDGYYGWYESKFQFFGDVESRQLQIVVVARDIGDRVKQERFETLRHSIAALKTTETNLEREFAGILATICGTLTWEMGEIWLIDDTSIQLKRKSFWCGPSLRLARFAEGRAQTAFSPGVGLPGMVWSQGKTSIVDSLSSLTISLHRQEYDEAGIKAAIGTVLADESRIYGVALFLSRRKIQHNRELLDMITETGLELGNFIAKFKAREEIDAASERLGAMVEEGTAKIRALQAEVSRQQRLEQDILLAAEVQRNLLPLGNPELPGFEFSSAAIPARYISGDFFDFSRPSPTLCDIVIADVSGKGIAAAMMTAAARTIFRYSDNAGKSPSRMLGEMNETLYADLDRTEMFLTAQLVRVDLARGSIAYASAGHTEALHCRPATGECRRLPSTAPPIGVMRAPEIGQLEIRTRPGDFFVVYSDGVTEAVNASGELFGMDRFAAILGQRPYRSAADLVQAILAELKAFSAEATLADDLTLVALRAMPRTLNMRAPLLMASLDSSTAFVRDASLPYGEKIADEMELIASELATNAITHAGPDPLTAGDGMEAEIRLEPDRIVFDLLYPGKAFDPEARGTELPNPLEEGGRGILIVRALADELLYSHDSGRNHWHLVKSIGEETLP